MKIMKYLRIIALTGSLLVLLLCTNSLNVFAASGELSATTVTRITHPAYQMTNRWQGEGMGGDNGGSGPWNKNHTRIMIYEPITNHPVYGQIGRETVWGYVSTLKGLGQIVGTDEAYKGSLSDYENNTYDFPSSFKNPPMWSLTEENIVYALKGTTEQLVKYNVDTGGETVIASYGCISPCSGQDVSAAQFRGWTADGEIMISFQGEKLDESHSGWYINTTTGSRTYFEPPSGGRCSVGGYNRPHAKVIHSGRSLDKLYQAKYGSGAYVQSNDYVGGDCTTTWWDSQGSTLLLSHAMWSWNNDWYVASGNGRSKSAPWITNTNTTSNPATSYFIDQVFFDRTTHSFTHNILFSLPTAGYWCPGGETTCGTEDVNYHGLMTPTLRNDSFQVMFLSTNGVYSLEDYQKRGSKPYGTRGMFLADLAPASGVQTCTSFTYSDWGECQSNNTQTRTVTSSSPSGCTGGTPLLTQSCTYSSGTPALTILKTTSTPTIDGNLTEYNNANSITFSPTSGGNTVTVKSLWTSEALYLGVNVTDTQLNASATTTDGSVWNDDSVEWFIDTYYDGGGSSNPDSAYMKADDYQGIVNILNTKYNSQGTTSGTPTSSWNGTWQSAVKLSGTANTNTDTGYSIEIKIPWTSIGYSSAPSADTFVGMSFAVNDKDADGTNSKMWLSSAGSNQNASNWQRISLSGTLATVDVVPPAPPGALMIQ